MKKILVLCFQGMGNTILTIPMIKSIRKNIPDAHISVITWNNGSDLILENLKEIDNVHVLSTDRSRIRNLKTIRKISNSINPTHCIVSWPPGIFSGLGAFVSGAQFRIGHAIGNRRFCSL